MIQKTPEELRTFAKSVAQNTRKPFDDILLKESKTKTITTEFKGGFLGLQTKTKSENQTYVEIKRYPLNCWLLDTYTEMSVDNDDYFSESTKHYALNQNGNLIVISLECKGRGLNNNTFFESSSAGIQDMTFLKAGYFTQPKVRVSLFSLLDNRSAYMLDISHCYWKILKGSGDYSGDYIQRDYPVVLRSEGGLEGAGEYKYSPGEGLYRRLESLMNS